MGMTAAQIKKFVEEDYKDHVIMVTCDNEHKFYHRAYGNVDIVWDWDNEVFIALEPTDEITDQNGNPIQVTQVSFGEIQLLTAYIDKVTSLKFISDKFTEETALAKAKKLLSKLAPSMMGPRTLRKNIDDKEYRP